MKNNLNRRRFLKRSVVAATTAAAFRFEEKALLADDQPSPETPPLPVVRPKDFPQSKIGSVLISRLICGGNLISGFAHSRDLIYVSRWLKEYFTDEKVFRTLALCEAEGINTAILRLDDNTLRILRTYWKERGGKIQWLAQIDIRGKDTETAVKQAADNGAIGAFTHGNVGDEYAQQGKVGLLGEAVQAIKARGLIAGIAGHSLEVPKSCEAAGIKPVFYMKTFNSKRYWSAGPLPRNDSVWEETPEGTKAFMEKVNRRGLRTKCLAPGPSTPEKAFATLFTMAPISCAPGCSISRSRKTRPSRGKPSRKVKTGLVRGAFDPLGPSTVKALEAFVAAPVQSWHRAGDWSDYASASLPTEQCG